MDLGILMRDVMASGSPDLHLQVGQPPVVRLRTGNVVAVEKYPVVTADIMNSIVEAITTEDQKKDFLENLETDFSFSLEGVGRFRVNIFMDRFGPGMAFRVISQEIPTLEQLGLGPEIEMICQQPHGLVLVTGPTGSGKSTTLASMINSINEKRQAHIITIEDPIEYIFPSKNCLITQRELNVHTRSFPRAIRAALRQDPDVVMVGEMRDLDTISAALTLAETGHLVFSTLHTQDAVQTIDRIIDVFPSNQQSQVRSQLASSLKAVISQILIPHSSGQGRVPAREIMITNDAIRNCIVQNQNSQIYSMIQIGSSEGMILMDDSLEELVRNNMVEKDEALSKAKDFESLSKRLEGVA